MSAEDAVAVEAQVEEVVQAQGEAMEEAMAANGVGEPGSDKGHAQEGAQEDEEPWRKRLWLVRMPRPPEAGALKSLEQEVDTYRTQFNLITEALNVKKVERDGAREAVRSAREAFQSSRAAYDERFKPVKELQQQRQEAASSATKLKDSFSDLLVKSEAELDEQLRSLHFRINHESITLNEEKKALATIKKLEQQRERVCEFEASAVLFAETRAKRSELQEVLKEHDGELKALRQEMDVQRQIMDKLREHEREIDAEVEEVISERRRCREIMEQAYQRLTSLKKEQWTKNNIFYSNRGFSRSIRKLVDEGKLEEARDACAEQMEEAHEQLKSDAPFRAEYFALWEQQRKQPLMAADEDLPPPSKGRKGGKAAKEEAPVDPVKKAEATIAAILEQARATSRAKAAAAPAPEPTPAPAEEEEAAAAAAAEKPRVVEIVGLEEGVAAEAARSAARAAKARPAPVARAVEPVVVPEENFELPEVVKANKAASSQELKDAEREHNRKAQAEAEQRKVKKQQDKERKRHRQEQLSREAAAAAERAAEAAAAAQAAAVAAAAVAEDVAAAADDSASSDAGGEASTPAPAPAVLEQRKKGGAGAKARRPAPTKQKGVVQQARKAAKDNSVLMVLGLVALFVFMLCMLYWSASTAQ